MDQIEHKIVVGSELHIVSVKADKIDGKDHILVDDLIDQQKKLACKLLDKSESFDIGLFNFAMDVSGKKGIEIASMLKTNPANISQIRRGKNPPSASLWMLFRIVMHSHLSNTEGQRAIDKIIYESGKQIAEFEIIVQKTVVI